MTIITIERRDYNALRACAAVNEVRYYLNGIYLDCPNQMLVATNGHHMLTVPMANVFPTDAPPCIVAIPKMAKLPKKIDHVRLNVATRTMETIDKGGAIFFTQPIELIDAKYAEWQYVVRKVPSWDAKATETRAASVPFNPKYLAAVTSALEVDIVDMRPGPSRGDVIVARFTRDDTVLDARYYLMPMRL